MRLPALLLTLFCACSSDSPAPTDAGQPQDAGEIIDSAAAIDAGGEADAAQAQDAATGDEDASAPACTGDSVVRFETNDALALEADFHLGGAGSPVAILLHMIPPSNDRSNYTPAFRQAFVDAGFSVLNIDRRGAGGSGGVAQEAYIGPRGAEDIASAIAFLEEDPCDLDTNRLVIVGASNGTTSALDYTLRSQFDGASIGPTPQALIFLSGGGYTEAQFTIAENLRMLELPIFFATATDDRASATWTATQEARANAAWSFMTYASGHGTHIFRGAPEAVAPLARWAAEQVTE